MEEGQELTEDVKTYVNPNGKEQMASINLSKYPAAIKFIKKRQSEISKNYQVNFEIDNDETINITRGEETSRTRFYKYLVDLTMKYEKDWSHQVDIEANGSLDREKLIQALKEIFDDWNENDVTVSLKSETELTDANKLKRNLTENHYTSQEYKKFEAQVSRNTDNRDNNSDTYTEFFSFVVFLHDDNDLIFLRDKLRDDEITGNEVKYGRSRVVIKARKVTETNNDAKQVKVIETMEHYDENVRRFLSENLTFDHENHENFIIENCYKTTDSDYTHNVTYTHENEEHNNVLKINFSTNGENTKCNIIITTNQTNQITKEQLKGEHLKIARSYEHSIQQFARIFKNHTPSSKRKNIFHYGKPR